MTTKSINRRYSAALFYWKLFQKPLKAMLFVLIFSLSYIVLINHLFIINLNQDKPSDSFLYFNSSKRFSNKYNGFLEDLGLTNYSDLLDITKPLSKVAIVSAASQNHAAEGRYFVKRMAEVHPDYVIQFYDIGLNKNDREWFKKACNVRIRDINLTKYGIYDLKTYRWKPIIIADAFNDFPALFWMDTSTFVSNKTMEEFVEKLNISKDTNVPHVYFTAGTGHSTYAVTVPGMFDYLLPQGDPREEQYTASIAIFFRTKSTLELYLKWLVLCALEKDCMAPPGHQLSCSFKDVFKDFANCHRYDQSAFNILALPYNNTRYKPWMAQFVTTKRGFAVPLNSSLPVCNVN